MPTDILNHVRSEEHQGAAVRIAPKYWLALDVWLVTGSDILGIGSLLTAEVTAHDNPASMSGKLLQRLLPK